MYSFEKEEVVVDAFAEKLVEEYKVPRPIAEECSASYSKNDQKVIEGFLNYYGKSLTMPDSRYGIRPRPQGE